VLASNARCQRTKEYRRNIMSSFVDFLEIRRLAEFIVDNEIDADAFCETILALAEKKRIHENALVDLLGDQIVLEAWFGIPGAARVAAGLGGIASAPGKWLGNKAAQGAQAIGNKVAQGASAVKGAVSNAYQGAKASVQAMGNKVAQGAQAVGNKVAQGAQAVKGAVGNAYNQAARAQAIKQVEDRVTGLYDALGALGYDRNTVDQMLVPLQQAMQQAKNPNP
jgi:hypothetical protein